MLHQAISRLVRWSCNHANGTFDFDEYKIVYSFFDKKFL